LRPLAALALGPIGASQVSRDKRARTVSPRWQAPPSGDGPSTGRETARLCCRI